MGLLILLRILPLHFQRGAINLPDELLEFGQSPSHTLSFQLQESRALKQGFEGFEIV